MPNVTVSRIVLASVAAVGMLATFLPWVHAPLMGAMPGSRGDGWFSFAAFAVVLALALLPSPRTAFGRAGRAAAVVLGAVALGLGVWKLVDLAQLRSEGVAEGGFAASFSRSTSAGIGIYLVIACGVAAAVVAIAARDRRSA